MPGSTSGSPRGGDARDGLAAAGGSLAGVSLAGLVASRLCHDLISPLGAIGNGVELMQLVAPQAGEANDELALIAESVAAARARIGCFRIAFGPSSGEQRVSRGEMEGLLRDMSASAGGRLRVDLDSQGDSSRAEVKLVLLAMMCLETALPWGGRVLVLRANPGWRLVAEATRTRPDAALWAWLAGDPALRRPEPSPAEVHFPVLAGEAAVQRRILRWEVDESGAEIAF